jgi:PAS domain S-box-containing protein
MTSSGDRRGGDAEILARATEESFRLLVDSVEEYAIFLLDTEGRVVTWNRGAERLKGWRAEEIIGRHMSCFYPPEVAAAHADEILALTAARGHYEEEGWRVRKDGTRFWASVALTAVRDDDDLLRGFAKVTRDMSERRERERDLDDANEELRKADAFRSQFLATTAHELANPITVIGGFVQTLRKQGANVNPEVLQTALERIERQVAQLTRLVEDLQVASRLDAGGLEVRMDTVDVRDVIDDALAHASGDTPVEVDCPTGLQVQADRDRLRQILANFVTNAGRYGEPPIRITARHADRAVEVVVEDAGAGVPADFADRLFDKFARHPEAARGVRGSGLGLFIVRGLAEAMGGEAWYEPNQPRGARFGVRLPAD